MSMVNERYILPKMIKDDLYARTPRFGFGGLGELVYLRTYSRIKEDGTQEIWPDTVVRVVEGVLSIYIDQLKKRKVKYSEEEINTLAYDFADYIYDMRFLPPGRGLWALGTEYVRERGGAALQNCGFADIKKLSEDAAWCMDMLMCGIGVGFSTHKLKSSFYLPVDSSGIDSTYVIPDTREGWVESVRQLIASYEKPNKPQVWFDYSQIRKAGEPIRGFGGTASGPEPLEKLHNQLRGYLNDHVMKPGKFSNSRLIADVMNAIGGCVVAGNVRRSAELATGRFDDQQFLDLKDYEKYPERAEIGWMSNNSVLLEKPEDFLGIPEIANRLIRHNADGSITVTGDPGIINMMSTQLYGRFKEKIYGKDNAVGFNPCVTGETPILTDVGHQPIALLEGVPVNIWNGNEWSRVTPKVTGTDQHILRVSFSDGTYLDCTPYHGFHVSDSYHATQPREVEAKDLSVGDKLWKYQMPVVEYGTEVDTQEAYTQGFFCGDGNWSDKGAVVYLYGEKRQLTPYMRYKHMRQEDTHRRTYLRLGHMPDKTTIPYGYDIRGRLAWFAGLLDADGTLLKDGQLQLTNTSKTFLDGIRLMLTTLGTQAKVTQSQFAGSRALPGGVYDCAATYRLLINATDVVTLRNAGLADYLHRIDITNVNPNRDARQFVRVVGIEDRGIVDKVYCFNEPINHTGTFNGIVTAQCAEQPLADKELCCLVEVFPTRCEDEETIYKAMRLATIFASTVSLLPTHDERTNAIIAKNHRIGVSISGVADWLESTSIAYLTKVLRHGYEKIVRPTNAEFMKFMGEKPSIRVTTVKPSGTVSQLAGVSPGMHWPTFRYAIRRMRISASSPLVNLLIDAKYPYEIDAYSDNTLVFEFPIDQGNTRSATEVSMWEQASMLAFLQREWSDNGVSCTIYFDPEKEGHDLERLLSMYTPQIKAMSLLGHTKQGAYKQMPYEGISYTEYISRKIGLEPVDISRFIHGGISDGEDSRFCENDTCEVTFTQA